MKIIYYCLEGSQLDNKKNYLEKNKIDIDSIFCYKGRHKEFVKNRKHCKHSKNLKLKGIMFLQEKLVLAHIMIKRCNQLIRWKHMHMEQAKI